MTPKKPSNPPEFCHIVLLGDPGVGKESICRKFTIGSSHPAYDPTDSSYRKMLTLTNPLSSPFPTPTEKSYLLELVSLPLPLPHPSTTSTPPSPCTAAAPAAPAAHDQTHTHAHIHRLASGFLLIYAVDSRDSFDHITEWYDEIVTARRTTDTGTDTDTDIDTVKPTNGGAGTAEIPMLLVAAKQDLPLGLHRVSALEGEALAERLGGCLFRGVSARREGNGDGDDDDGGVEEMFVALVREIWRLRKEREAEAVAATQPHPHLAGIPTGAPKRGFGEFMKRIVRLRPFGAR